MNLQMVLMDALPLIKQFAPTIATAIGGPVGMAVGYTIPVLAHVFNVNPTNLKDLASKINSDPDATNKLQELEAVHGEFIKTLIGSIHDLTSAEVNIKLNWDTK